MMLLLTVLGCIICVGSALLIAWIGGKYTPQTYVLAKEASVETEDVAAETEPVSQEAQALLPQWLFYRSAGTDEWEEEKSYFDVLVNRWTKGKLTDDELSQQMTDYLVKKEVPISSIGVQSEALCLFPSAQELPDYTAMLTEGNDIYDFIGVYTNGEYDEEGRLICYYWEAGVIAA
jgi:hypothetical protein